MNLISKTAAGVAMFGALGASVSATAKDIILMEQQPVEVNVLVPYGTRQVPVTRMVQDPCSANGWASYTIMENQVCYRNERRIINQTVPVRYRSVEPRNCPIARGVGQFIEGAWNFPGQFLGDLTEPLRRPYCTTPVVVPCDP